MVLPERLCHLQLTQIWVKASVEGCFWSPQLNQGFAGFQVLPLEPQNRNENPGNAEPIATWPAESSWAIPGTVIPIMIRDCDRERSSTKAMDYGS